MGNKPASKLDKPMLLTTLWFLSLIPIYGIYSVFLIGTLTMAAAYGSSRFALMLLTGLLILAAITVLVLVISWRWVNREKRTAGFLLSGIYTLVVVVIPSLYLIFSIFL